MKIPLSTQPSPEPGHKEDAPNRKHIAKTVGRIIAICFALGTLTFLWYMFEDWRGGRSWVQYVSEPNIRKWRFDWEYYVPPLVSDEENFAKTPALAPLYDYDLGSQFWRDTNASLRIAKLEEHFKEQARMKGLAISKIKTPRADTARRVDLTGIFTAPTNSVSGTNSQPLQGHSGDAPIVTKELAAKNLLQLINENSESVFAELRQASQKPKARFDIKYRVVPLADIFLPHLPVIQHLAQQLSWRAFANLELNNPNEAFEDALLIFYLGDTLKGEPFLVSHHTRLACRSMAAQVVYEGLAAHKWTETQLKTLQAGLSKDDFPADDFQCMLAERAYSLRLIDQICTRSMRVDRLSSREKTADMQFWLTVMPAGWFYFEAINVGRSYDKILLAMEEWLQGKRDIKSAIEATSSWPGINMAPGTEKPVNMMQAMSDHEVLIRLMAPAVNKSFLKNVQAQVRNAQIVVACALECYRLAKGEYPETIEALTPHYLDKQLPDLFSNGPMKYRRETANSYVLYSVGPNLLDDGGKVELDTNGVVQPDKGDLVWQIK